jgi:hypothetical protein
VTIRENPFHIEIYDAGGRLLTETDHKSDNTTSFTPMLPFGYVRRAADFSRSYNAAFTLAPGEKIFGCGESFTRLDKRGQKLVLWTDDANGGNGETREKGTEPRKRKGELIATKQAIKVGKLRGGPWRDVEWHVTMPLLFIEYSFILRGGNSAPGPGANPDAAFESHGRRIRRPRRDHGNFRSFERPFPDGHRGWRKQVAIGLDISQGQEQLVGDGDVFGNAFVIHTHKQHAGFLMVRQIIGQSTNDLARLFRHISRPSFFALSPVRFQIVQESLKFCIGYQWRQELLTGGAAQVLAGGEPALFGNERRAGRGWELAMKRHVQLAILASAL